MSAAVPLREDFSADALRRLARGSRDAGQSRRLLALATIDDGGRRMDVARTGAVGLSVMIITDWYYNLLFRWFVGLEIDAPVWHPTVFTHTGSRWARTSSSMWKPSSATCGHGG